MTSKAQIKAFNKLRDEAAKADAQRVAEYRDLWAYLWNDRRPALGVDCRTMNTDVRAMVLAFCRDGVPVETAKMITLEWMKGLSE